MSSNSSIRAIIQKSSQNFESIFKIYSPDESTELTNEDGLTPFGKVVDVNTENILALDPNWTNVTTAYRVTLTRSTPPSTTDSYWIEINGIKERVEFGKYITKHGFFTVYFKGD